MKLRPYQAEALNKVKLYRAKGVNRQAVKLPTGMGKTPLFAHTAEFLGLQGRALVLVHREELAQQGADELRVWNPSATVGVEMGELRSAGERFVVAGVRTIGNKGSARLTQFNPKDFDLIITDECFVAGTDVAGTPIQHIRVGDTVPSFDAEGTESIREGKVTRLFKRKPKTLLRVSIRGAYVICTPEHPFYTTKGWLKAKDITNEKVLIDELTMHRVWGSDRNPHLIPTPTMEVCRKSVLRKGLQKSDVLSNHGKHQQEVRISKNDSAKPYAQRAFQEEGAVIIDTDGTQTRSEGWKRNRANGTREDVSRRDWSTTKRDRSNTRGEVRWLSNLLQTRHGRLRSSPGSGGRRKLALPIKQARARQKEGSVLSYVRVDSVEVLQPGSDGRFGGLCPDGYVYNIEVEKYNTYVANGFVVHNCHHSPSQSYKTVFDHFNVFDDRRILSLGVTATVNRSDGNPLGDVYEEIVYEKTIADSIREGWLVNLRGIRILTGESLDDVKTLAGDFQINQLGNKVNTAAMNDMTVRSWLEHCKDRQSVAYCVDVDHSKRLAETFQSYGVACQAVWGGDPDRAEKLAVHRAGGLKVITNCEILIEGYNDPGISCIVMARPTKSELLFTQCIGRGTRIQRGIDNLIEAKAAGVEITKEDCIILDMVHNTSKHSLITLASLFGLAAATNLKGKKITQVLDELEAAKIKHPMMDVAGLKDIDELKSYAEHVDLFQVKYPPEIEAISPNQWRKVDQAYVLLLMDKGHLTVIPDLLGKWHTFGNVGPYSITECHSSLEEAVRNADQSVSDLGSRQMALCAKRVLKTDNQAPSQAMLTLCQRMRIPVPPGATFGEVRRKIGAVLAEKKRRRVA